MAGQQQPMQPYAPPTEDQQQQPMMQQPMMQQPMMQQQPMQPPMQQPYADPYGDQQPAPDMGMAPIGYEDGGSVLPTARMAYNFMSSPEGLLQGAGNPALMAGSTLANLLGRNVRGPSKVVPVDITAPAGTVRDPSEAIAADIVAKAEDLATKVDTTAPEDIGKEIVNTAASKGLEPSGDLKFDLAAILEEMTGDPDAYEKNIDTLNRGIIGAAIASGTSARATENIARGMLVGMEGAKATEERRAGDARALQLKALEVRAAEQGAREAEIKASERAKAEAAIKLEEDKRKAYYDTFKSVMELGIDGVDLPVLTDEEGNPVIDAEGKAQRMTLEDYARQVAEDQVKIGFPSAQPDVEDVLDQARRAIKEGRDPAVISDRLKSMGIDPGLL